MQLLIAVFAVSWLLAMLWLVLIARLLRRLVEHDQALYALLGKPVMRLPGGTFPGRHSGTGGTFVSLSGLSQGQVDLRVHYGLDELLAAARLWAWIVFSRPRPSTDRHARRLQRQLRLCGGGCLLGLVALFWMAIQGL